MEHLKENEVIAILREKAKYLYICSMFLQTGLLQDIVQLFKSAKDLYSRLQWIFNETPEKNGRLICRNYSLYK